VLFQIYAEDMEFVFHVYFAGLCQTLKNKVHAYFAALSQTQKSSIQTEEKFEKYNQMVHIKKRTTTHVATQMFHEKSLCYRLRVSSNLMPNTFHSHRKQLSSRHQTPFFHGR
jgi:hypothetical protein